MKRLIFVARRARLVVAIAALATGLNAVAQAQVVRPLKAVEADSVELYDFFWSRVQREADKAMGDGTRAWPWQTDAETPEKLAERVAAWEKRLENLDLWGLDADAPCRPEDFKQLLRESIELGMLTRQARFYDLAERLLYNPAMRYWHDCDKDNADREVADALRAVGSAAYAVDGHDVFLNMLIRCNVHLQSDSVDFCAQMINSCPWYNDTSLRIVKDMSLEEAVADTVLSEYSRVFFYEEYEGDSVDITFHIRIPQWLNGGEVLPRYTAKGRRQRLQISVNGAPVIARQKDGYAIVERRWAIGDLMVIKLPTPILRVYDKQDDSRVALQRGPLLYASGNKAPGWSFDPDSAVGNEFSQPLQAIQLKGELINEHGKKPFNAAPAYLSDERDAIFMPVR